MIALFICYKAGEVGSLDLRSSRALTLSNISAGTGSVLIGLCGKPETGQVARIMRFTRNNYHSIYIICL